jgi:predicted dehydrogenase
LLNNFRSLVGYGVPVRLSLLKQDKGHRNEILKFLEAVKGKTPPPISFEESVEVTLAAIAARKSLKIRLPINIKEFEETNLC